ncbi:phosphatase PAP2 family protein [Streptomyces sp. BI20]|uniref:phosphatase PAP2 family protein n=1 Tax=Streptomyces sp. BI20 TaxID=3403460 RepID=UPI003C73EAA7
MRHRPTRGDTRATDRPHLLREIALVTAMFALYKAGRLLTADRTEDAFRNADLVRRGEQALHLPDEAVIQHLLVQVEPVIKAANTYYAAVHFPAAALFLGWLWLRRPGQYRRARTMLALLTGAGLAVHLLFPLAPPRLAATGMIDTGRVYGPTVYGAAPDSDHLANQYAAMPSLHFGWALLIAVLLIAAGRTRARWLWLLHPALTLLVIVGTANHYWLDSLVAAALVGAVTLPLWAPARRPAPLARRATPLPPAPASAPASAPEPFRRPAPAGGRSAA